RVGGPAEHTDAYAAESDAIAQPPRRGQHLRARRLCDRGPRWSFGRVDLRHGFRSFRRGRGRKPARPAWRPGARGFSPAFRLVLGTGRAVSSRDHRGCPREDRRRGRDTAKLGCHYRFRRDLCRNAIVRRERALQGTVQEIWDYRRSGRQRGVGEAWEELTNDYMSVVVDRGHGKLK